MLRLETLLTVEWVDVKLTYDWGLVNISSGKAMIEMVLKSPINNQPASWIIRVQLLEESKYTIILGVRFLMIMKSEQLKMRQGWYIEDREK